MKRLLSIACLLSLLALPAAGGNYLLTIDGKQYELDLDEEQAVQLPGGKSLTVVLAKKDVGTFKTEKFSFDHPSSLEPARTKLQEGLHQTMASTPLGTVVMVQEYDTLDPTSLVEMMVGVMTDDEAKLGRKVERSDAERKLSDGTLLKGRRATYSGEDDQMEVEVFAHGDGSTGVLIITQIDRTNPAEEAQLQDRFWQTLKLNGT